MYHVSSDGVYRKCHAKTKESCRYFIDENDPRHYETEEEARIASEKILEKKYSVLNTRSKYSFVKEFKKKEDEFNRDFNDIPTRFFNADLGKIDKLTNYDDVLNNSYKLKMDYYHNQVIKNLLKFTSSPSDLGMSSEEVENHLKELGFKNIEVTDDKRDIRAFTGDETNRVWRAESPDGKVYAIVDKSLANKNFGRYYFRRRMGEPWDNTRKFAIVDTRYIAGVLRTKKLTGQDLLKVQKDLYNTQSGDLEEKSSNIAKIIVAYKALEMKQNEGNNFKMQKGYIKNHSGQIATAWMDKKNVDKTHEELMKKTRMKKYFKKVEVDNDVDPEEFESFTKSYESVKDILPAIPGDRKPILRIRKLGKHNATGLFFPSKNTLCVDVHDSGSFIHEYGHYLDFTVHNNSSLSKDFYSILDNYKKNVKVPNVFGGKKIDYYSTPTEVLARGFELYAHDKLHINNRLLNADNFTRFDYEPFQNDESKKKLFSFFDKLFEK